MTKTAWVIGASSGIGEGVARELKTSGYTVIGLARRKTNDEIIDRNYYLDLRERGEVIAARINHFLTVEGLGITDQQEIEYLWEANYFPGWRKFWQLSKIGAPDLLVISAGAGAYLNLAQWHDYNWLDCKGKEHLGVNELLHINLIAKLWICNAMLRAMRRKRTGTIIVIGSRVAANGANALELYGAAQAGLRGFITSAHRHPAKRGVTLALYEPGWTATPMSANLEKHILEASNKKWGAMATVEEVAKQIVQFSQIAMPGEIAGDNRYNA